MKDKAHDLHNILFEQLERLRDLDDDDIKAGKLVTESQRTKAIESISTQIINNGRLVYDAIQLQIKTKGKISMPDMLQANGLKYLPEPDEKKEK